jgi:hypothetical protein
MFYYFMKPKLLRDLTISQLVNEDLSKLLQNFLPEYGLPADGVIRTIGRNQNCDIRTFIPSEKMRVEDPRLYMQLEKIAQSVSRIHALICHQVNGQVYIISKGETYIGTDTEKFEQQVHGRELVLEGQIITLGKSYSLKLESVDAVALRNAEARKRMRDTDVIDVEEIFGS